MKKQIFKTILSAFVLVMLCGLFATTATAQNTSVTITVKAVPVVAETDPGVQCPDATSTSYTNSAAASHVPTHTFNIPVDAQVTSSITTPAATFQYTEVTASTVTPDWASTLTPAEYGSYTVNAGDTKYIWVRAQVASAGTTVCWSDDVLITLEVKEFPGLAISGSQSFTVCGGGTENYTTAPAADSYTWSILAGGTASGTITNSTAATPSIKWADNTTGSDQTATLQLVYVVDGCTYTVTQEVTVTSRPVIVPSADVEICYVAKYDLTTGVTLNPAAGASTASIVYSTTSDFASTMTAAEAAAFAITPATGFDGTIYMKVTGTCDSDVASYKLNVYPQITANLSITGYTPSTVTYEECANPNGTDSTVVNLNLIVTGGCRTAASYVVTVTVPTGMTLGSTATGVTVSGGTVTITGDALTTVGTTGVALTITVPATGATGDVVVTNVTANKGGTCTQTCSQTF